MVEQPEFELGLPAPKVVREGRPRTGVVWDRRKWARPIPCDVCLNENAGVKAPNYAIYVRTESGKSVRYCYAHAGDQQERDVIDGKWKSIKTKPTLGSAARRRGFSPS